MFSDRKVLGFNNFVNLLSWVIKAKVLNLISYTEMIQAWNI